MSTATSSPRYQLYYWPIAFRGCFVSYPFAYRGVPLLVEDDIEQIQALMGQAPRDQAIPFVGPPALRDLDSGRTLSQVPAIVLHIAGELGLLPEDPFDVAMCMKVLMDCNDLLMEICRYNGSMMWEREEWIVFRAQRLPRWLAVFEESLKRGYLGQARVTFADLGTYALFGNMMRCLPELQPDVMTHATGIHALCRDIGAVPTLAEYVEKELALYGPVYCGGQIEESIRTMLALDAG